MKARLWVSCCALLALASFCVAQERRKPAAFDLQCEGSDCPILKGSPQTTGMRSGFVRLKPGESVGEHSTQDHEEALVVLRGEGKAEVEGHEAVSFSSRNLIYIPPRSRHNVTNIGKDLLEYVYVVAPVGKE
jgi:mannose-6-phosphate isomerase-like protein (cupin superfamily)